MSLLAGFQTLLSRYSGQEQIVIGTDVANRTTTETERLNLFSLLIYWHCAQTYPAIQPSASY